MNREQIINLYISVYEGHAMEKEELENMLNGFADDIVNNLQPSLPDNLDESAKEIVIKMHPCLKDCTILGDRLTRGQLMALVKAGAEWMAHIHLMGTKTANEQE
jgi:hypothetical protein